MAGVVRRFLMAPAKVYQLNRLEDAVLNTLWPYAVGVAVGWWICA